MTSKTISLKEDTYRRLKGVKAEDESFSDVIDRMLRTEEHPLRALFDLLDDEQVARLRDRSAAFRRDADDRLGVPDSR